MISKDNWSIPAQRYFTLDQLCQLVGISQKQFEAWQRDYGYVGYGGRHYTRLDVLKVMQLKHTFAPYVDAFTHNFVDEAGNPAVDAIEVQQQLQQLLHSIDHVLTVSNLVEQQTS
ncbi:MULTISPECIES: hypothetical protein [Vitreoscilla]|uniref:HTH merR-type domain-containing protein n=1 Tax=Vitreoscilla stercoraria TaxID=61 RepID=A0ABY4E7N5_VITST|nr:MULTISPECIES: hypothetical protein [Vitreoscilla]QJQ52166.1 hypothetical protein ADP71_40150 [Vitreoscilla sp. C1]UOO91777.1 hypothetical protein LVJ81_09050 [Vitreoscilla stercoraria]